MVRKELLKEPALLSYPSASLGHTLFDHLEGCPYRRYDVNTEVGMDFDPERSSGTKDHPISDRGPAIGSGALH